MNNQFNLNDLRSDASDYLADQLEGSPDDAGAFDHYVDIMGAALIGSYIYGTLNFDSSATIQL